jgi:Zn-dependent protease
MSLSPLELGLIVFELVVMLLAISLHDAAQAWMANRLGDPTARMMGRISLNPARHFDLFGCLIWPVLYIFRTPLVLGWGKPVPMTYRNFRTKNGEMLAVLAGPAAQFLAAVVCLILLVVLKHTVPGTAASLGLTEFLAMRVPVDTSGTPSIFPLLLLLYLAILVNLLLCVFNLLPIPFVDGGKILVHFLPYNAAKAFEQYSMWIMVAFFFLGFYVIMLIFQPVFGLFNGLLRAL